MFLRLLISTYLPTYRPLRTTLQVGESRYLEGSGGEEGMMQK